MNEKPNSTSSTCPSCNAIIPNGAVLCVVCGYHLKLRKKLEAQKEQPEDQTNPLETFDPPITSRPYRHNSCAQDTVISGGDFAILCDPFRGGGPTFCSHCEVYDEVRNFAWTDTGENLARYRKRITPTDEELAPGKTVAIIGLCVALVAAPIFVMLTPTILRLVGYHAADFLVERIIGGLIGFAAGFIATLLIGTPFLTKTPSDYRQFK